MRLVSQMGVILESGGIGWRSKGIKLDYKRGQMGSEGEIRCRVDGIN